MINKRKNLETDFRLNKKYNKKNKLDKYSYIFYIYN